MWNKESDIWLMIGQIRKEAFWSTCVLRPDAEALVTVRWRNVEFDFEVVKAVTMLDPTALFNAVFTEVILKSLNLIIVLFFHSSHLILITLRHVDDVFSASSILVHPTS